MTRTALLQDWAAQIPDALRFEWLEVSHTYFLLASAKARMLPIPYAVREANYGTSEHNTEVTYALALPDPASVASREEFADVLAGLDTPLKGEREDIRAFAHQTFAHMYEGLAAGRSLIIEPILSSILTGMGEPSKRHFLPIQYVDLPLPIDAPATAHCGTCTRCIEVCPTQAITAPYRLDARRCISYLTIEHEGAIPEDLRPAIGNRIFGCDDCQLVCPWNKFARRTDEPDFRARNDLDVATLPQLFAWSEDEFLRRTEGSAIRRSGHERWLRNIAVALGNAPSTPDVLTALASRRDDPSAVVREHVSC